MKFATIETSQGFRLHVKGIEGYVDVAHACKDESLSSLRGLILGSTKALESALDASEKVGREVREAEFAPAVPDAARILCLGLNYRDHALEGGREIPSWPEVFVRGSGTLLAPFADLVRPALSEHFDFEGELGVVIGKGGRYIRRQDALDAVAGYVVLNDATAREWQRESSQWGPGKNFEGSMPIGPHMVTPDEIDPSCVSLTTTLNGVVMQQANTEQLIFDVASCIEFLSSFTVLRPGDVIATGTPSGVGFARKPPLWLKDGDVIEVAIEGIGCIKNRVVDEKVAEPSSKSELLSWPWKPGRAQGSGL